MALEGFVLVIGAGKWPDLAQITLGLSELTHLGSGIGRETGYIFAEKGASGIVFADIDKKAAQDAAEASKNFAANGGYRAIALHVDVTDRSSVQAVVATTQKEFGRIDYNINTAGVCLRHERVGF